MGNFPKLPEGTQLPVGSHQVTVLKYLSEGGFAHIYKVQIDPPEEDSEIACLKRVIVPDKNGLNLLRKEVDVMKTLRYGRNIVKYYDSHAERLDNGTYQVLVLMELCPNKSLLDYMNAKIKTKLTESEILKIMLDISIGIYEMHRLNMIHRDIKIENVLIDAKHNFKLCDFGSTASPIMPPKDQQQFQLLSHDILYQTTPQYRSPEMIDLYRGFPIDDKSDIWAFGCFLYKLCYYTTPFETNGDIAILHASFQFLPAPSFSGDLKNLIIIMLQESPLLRPNIVQVIMLLSKMMNLEFKELKLDDFVGVGPYNFHALHEFQRQKHNEILKNQQLYYQQHHSVSNNSVPKKSISRNPSAVSLGEPAKTPSKHLQVRGRGQEEQLQGQLQDQKSQGQEYQPKQFFQGQGYLDPSQANSHLSVEHTQGQSLSLQTSQPHISAQNSLNSRPSQNSSNKTGGSGDEKIEKTEGISQVENSDDLSDDFSFGELNDLDNLDNAEERFPSLDDLLDNKPKTSNTYNASEDVNLKKVLKINTDTEERGIQNEDGGISDRYLEGNVNPRPLEGNVNPRPLDGNVNPRPLDSNVGNLVNHPQFLVKPVVLGSEEIRKLSRDQLKQYNYEHQFYQSQLAKQNFQQPQFAIGQPQQVQPIMVSPRIQSSLGQPIPNEQSQNMPLNVASMPQSQQHSPEQVKTKESRGYESKEAWEKRRSQIDKSAMLADDIFAKSPPKSGISNIGIENNPRTRPMGDTREDVPERDSQLKKVPDFLNVQNPPELDIIDTKQQPDPPYPTDAIFSNPVNGNNPFPVEKFAHLPNEELSTQPTNERKNANPWGEYRMPTSNVTTSQGKEPELDEKLNSMSLGEIRKASIEDVESNLIDLEVGLESSSNSLAPPSLRHELSKFGMESETSLIDLDSDEEKVAKGEPKFKKRISSLQNTSRFSFQEEVIDWASDDENPANDSRMNRLSIRNSLKKPKSRKSSEHKRSDSANSEGKKRISFFGGNNV
jgi:Serine/threonine protein kinase